MMKPTRPSIRKGGTYPPEFREEAVRYWLSSGQTLNDVASDLGLTPESLRVWRCQMEETPRPQEPEHDSSASNLALAREIGQLKRELEAMTRQRNI
jgi:transposase-like protein